MAGRWIFAATLFANVFCAAVNAYTYRVAYPLWRSVGAALPAVHKEYLRRLWPVITLPHVVMFFASGAMLIWRPSFVPMWCAVLVFDLDLGVVLVSAFAAGPLHDRITKFGAMDDKAYRGLMSISAARVVMMLLACALLFAVMLPVLS